MNETRNFILFSLITAFFSFALIVWNTSVRTSKRMARGFYISSVVLMLVCVFGHLRSRVTSEAIRAFVGSEYLLKGLCLSVSISFLATEIGKLAHDAEMRQFFLGAGYPVWFLYFIITAETLGAVVLLVSKMIVPAAFGLTLIMLGAIYTHYQNKDLFSDSIEALHLLSILVCIIIISLLRTNLRNGYATKFYADR